jgi:Holliday junction resolvase
MRRAARTDSNHVLFGQTLRELGYSVIDTHALGKKNAPDWLAGRNGTTICVEAIGTDAHPHTIKEHEDRRLGWKGGPWIVAKTRDDLLAQLGVSVNG